MDPLTLIALLATLGGVGANAVGAKKTDKAQADVMAANRIRNQGLDEQSFKVNERAESKYKGIEDQAVDREAELTEMLTNRPAGEDPSLGLPASSSKITVDNANEARGEAKDFTDQQGAAKAKLMSLGSLFGDIDRSTVRDAGELGQVNSFRQGWNQNVMPAELDAASEAGAGWRMGGDILGGIGSIATMGALSGAAMPGMSALTQLFGGAPGHAARIASAARMPTAARPSLMSLY